MENKFNFQQGHGLKSLYNDYFFNQKINRRSSEMLVVKKILSFSLETKLRILGENIVLDNDKYKKNFESEKDLYSKYCEIVFYDKDVPEKSSAFIKELTRKSRFTDRFVASRIREEHLFYLFGYNEEKSIYFLAKNYLEELTRNMEENIVSPRDKINSIKKAIFSARNLPSEKERVEYVGGDIYTAYLSYFMRLNEKDWGFFSDCIDTGIMQDKLNPEETREWIKENIGSFNGFPNTILELVQEKLRINYFPLEKFNRYLRENS